MLYDSLLQFQLLANFTCNKVLKSRQFSQINLFLKPLLLGEDCLKSAHLLTVKRLIVQSMSSDKHEIVKLCFPVILFGMFYLFRATILDRMKSCLKYLPLENLFHATTTQVWYLSTHSFKLRHCWWTPKALFGIDYAINWTLICINMLEKTYVKLKYLKKKLFVHVSRIIISSFLCV